MSNLLTTRQAAELLGASEWRIRRLYEDGTLPEPPRFGGKRVIAGGELPSIIDALGSRGWLPPAEESVANSSEPLEVAAP